MVKTVEASSFPRDPMNPSPDPSIPFPGAVPLINTDPLAAAALLLRAYQDACFNSDLSFSSL